jgi:hypothetical protein
MWDGAIAHTSNQSLLALIEVFDELDIDHWPLSFPDLNLCDFSLWHVLESKLKSTAHTWAKNWKKTFN